MRHLTSRMLRPVAVLATGAVIATTLSTQAGAAPAGAAAKDRSAAWLERQLTDGLIHNDQFDFDDYGLTADVGIGLDYIGGRHIGLDYIGGRHGAISEIADVLAENVDNWTTFDSDIFAGSVAKAVVLAQSAERDPRSFGGVNLVRRLAARVSDNAPYVGRIADKGESDFSNTIGQAFAAVGLADAGSPKAGPVLRFLLRQQCSEGYFRLNFADKSKRRQGCDAGNADLSAPDTDVTALAVLVLNALPTQGPAVWRATDNAVDWLTGAQKRNGSFGGGPSTEASNTNSTGLAAWALGDASACRPAVKAARWVRDLQVRGDVSGTPLAGERGAIAYDKAAMAAAQADGITVETRDQWRRATSQAAPALVFTTLRRCRR